MSLLQLSILKNSSVLQKDSRVSLILCKQNFCAPVSHARLLCGFSTSKNSDTQDIWVRVQSFRREKSRALPISTRRSFQDLRASFTGIRLSDFGFWSSGKLRLQTTLSLMLSRLNFPLCLIQPNWINRALHSICTLHGRLGTTKQRQI